jgi:hypothetical protein
MKNRVKMLKVKVKSLAAEARIIRLEERRAVAGSWLHRELYLHRIHDLRDEQRSSLLAYAFLRGKARAACEPKTDPHNPPDYARVLKLAGKFGPVGGGETKDQLAVRFSDWWQVAAAAAK